MTKKDKTKAKDWLKFKEENEVNKEVAAQSDEDETEKSIEGEGKEAALEHPSYTALEEKLTLAEQKAHENWEKAVRAMAEVDNIRRRAERDIANAHRYGQEKSIQSLLPVIDSLEQAIQLTDGGDANMREGLELTLKLFIDAMKKMDVEQINPEGAQFDPHEHEAMSMLEAPGVEPHTIITVFQKGYKLKDRIIRPARVIVAK